MNVAEYWLPVVDYEGMYEVSTLGRVKSLARTVWHPVGRAIRLMPERIMSQRSGSYLTVMLCRNGEERIYSVHVLMLEAFVCARPAGMEGCHADDIRANNVLSNLRWDTPSANRLDSVRNGTHPNARKTACKRMHQYTPENTYWQGERRSCRTCRTQRNKERVRS